MPAHLIEQLCALAQYFMDRGKQARGLADEANRGSEMQIGLVRRVVRNGPIGESQQSG
jgi:hypothetical protein